MTERLSQIRQGFTRQRGPLSNIRRRHPSTQVVDRLLGAVEVQPPGLGNALSSDVISQLGQVPGEVERHCAEGIPDLLCFVTRNEATSRRFLRPVGRKPQSLANSALPVQGQSVAREREQLRK